MVNRFYFAVFLVTLSGYALLIGVEYAQQFTEFPDWFVPASLLIYALSAVAGAHWAPSSLPRSPKEDAATEERGASWLPWVMGLQGLLVALGVSLGAWFRHDDVSGEGLIIVGLSVLASMVLVLFGVLAGHRFAVLALNRIPPSVQEELGLR